MEAGKLTLCHFEPCRNTNEAFNFSPSFKVQGNNSDSGICKFSRWEDGSLRFITIYANLVQCWRLQEHDNSLQKIAAFKVSAENSKKGIDAAFIQSSSAEKPTTLLDRANYIVIFDSLGRTYLWNPDQETHLTCANKEVLSGLLVCNSVPNSRNLLVTVHHNLPLIGVQSFPSDLHTTTVIRHLKYSANGLINSVVSPAEHGSCLALGAGNCLTLWGCSTDEWNVSARFVLNSVKMSSISALAWHPLERFANIIAFATSNGLVGTHNINSSNPHKDVSEACPGTTVYRVAWGPKILFKGFSSSCTLYSVCNGSLYGHGFSSAGFSSLCNKSFNLKSTLVSLMDPAPTKYADHFICDCVFELPLGDSDPVLTEDESLMHLISKSGRLYTYLVDGESNIRLLQSEQSGQSIVNGLACTSRASSNSSLLAGQRRIAIVGREDFVSLITFQLKRDENSATQVVSNATRKIRLNQTSGFAIFDVDFSPFDPELLVSSGLDQLAHVWRVSSTEDESQLVCQFDRHKSSIINAKFSRHVPDLVISSSKGLSTVFAWSPSTCPRLESQFRPPPETSKKTVKNPINIPQPRPVPEIVNTRAKNRSKSLVDLLDLHLKFVPIPKDEPFYLLSPVQSDTVTRILFDSNSLPPVTVQPYLELFLAFLSKIPAQNNLLYSLLSEDLDRRVFIDTLLTRANNYFQSIKSRLSVMNTDQKQAALNGYFVLLLWLGEVKLVIQRMLEVKYLPNILLYAVELTQTPGFGDDLLHAKVEQMLVNNENPMLAATLLVCVGESQQSVQHLVKADLGLEAYLLARIRVADRDLLDSALRNWTKILLRSRPNHGVFEALIPLWRTSKSGLVLQRLFPQSRINLIAERSLPHAAEYLFTGWLALFLGQFVPDVLAKIQLSQQNLIKLIIYSLPLTLRNSPKTTFLAWFHAFKQIPDVPSVIFGCFSSICELFFQESFPGAQGLQQEEVTLCLELLDQFSSWHPMISILNKDHDDFTTRMNKLSDFI
ncbi:Gem-associated protein 5 [Cichlidogyrus casuarinus]|uniref:Gem-associated protein 5 n=1 Tax=Cichlidogyrus casuarinus TaxID=1844966 RepID=A0ABD2QHQ6_9PLAT